MAPLLLAIGGGGGDSFTALFVAGSLAVLIGPVSLASAGVR
ncbi:hypothetical protein [Streptomyces sp. CB01635]|nr:hypothetical protein [Streptomyces sp. CB01635]